MIDVLGLRVLVAIAETGSVTAAAAELGYSPSNVTQHLRRLEAKLHTPMVERVGRGIVLTDQAARLVRRGRKLLDELDDLAVETMARPSGRFDVAAFPTAMRGLLIPTVADLVRDEPDLRVQPHELEPAAALDRLRAGRVRAAVVKEWGAAAALADGSLITFPLGVDLIDIVLPRAHPMANRPSLELVDLVDQSWALTPEGERSYRDWFISHENVLALKPRMIYEAAEFSSLIGYVEHNLAVAAIPRLGRGPLPSATVAVPLRDPSARRTVSVAVRATSRDSATVGCVVDALRVRAAGILS